MASCDVCASGLPSTTNDADLRELFEVFGPVAAARVSHHGGQRLGFVSFRSPQSAMAAIAAMRGFNFKGASIHVRLASHVQVSDDGGLQEIGQQSNARTQLSDIRMKGQVIAWKGNYGWIASDTRIDHPDAKRHDGAVYVHARDTEGGVELQLGQRVSFRTYVDNEGIGACEVCLQDSVGVQDTNDATPVCAGSHQSIVHVDGWPPSLEDSFRKTFEHFGIVQTARVARPKQQGTRASGRLVFASRAAARAAISAMDGKMYGGRPLRVWLERDDNQGGVTEVADSASFPIEDTPKLKIPQKLGPLDGRVEIEDGPRLTGKVSSWKGKFGWIIADRHIPDPPNAKHKGWIFVNMRDLGGVSSLSAGDLVSFRLYTDKQGNGAYQVALEHSTRPSLATHRTQTWAQPPTRWWHGLAGDCCPISLTPLEELEYEPFGLVGSADTSSDDPPRGEGLWGAAAESALSSKQAVHWFDGKFLACSLASKRQFEDPVNRRPLTRGECESLDEYIASNSLPAIHVVDAFDRSRVDAPKDSDGAEVPSSPDVSIGAMLRLLEDGPALSQGGSEIQRVQAAVGHAKREAGREAACKPRRWGRQK
mmetsp:Transcript_45587/g.126521  ORF Transcript_45587/g.126521 Transcript_45587/m.126521 type:complete len:593 (+) Transcript_45587:48-1826(+)